MPCALCRFAQYLGDVVPAIRASRRGFCPLVGLCAVMADGVAADTLPDPPICRAEDAVLYAVPRPAAQEYYRCTARDMQALRSYAPTDLAYRFRDALDPQLLCQSLFCMSAQYPKCFGRLVNVDGECMIRTNSHDPGLRALPLPPSAVDSRAQWQRVLDAFPLREPGFAGNRLFQALLLHTPDPGDGCVLLLTVDHMLGDAGTCAALAKALSAHYRELSGASAAAVMAAPAPDRHAALAAEVCTAVGACLKATCLQADTAQHDTSHFTQATTSFYLELYLCVGSCMCRAQAMPLSKLQ